MSENIQGMPLSVLEFIATAFTDSPVCFGIKPQIKHKSIQVLKQTSAEHLINRRICDLSGGEIQRIMLSFALAATPNILLLDEPISGIDHNGVAEFWNVINQIRLTNDIAIIIVSHDFGQVRKHASQVILLDKTILKTASPSEIFTSTEFRSVFHI